MPHTLRYFTIFLHFLCENIKIEFEKSKKTFYKSRTNDYNKIRWAKCNQKLSVEEVMAVSYNNLWKLMIDKKINKSELCKTVKISSSTMAKMSNEEMVAMPILEKICAELECNIGDIMEFTELESVRRKLHEDE